MAAKPAKAAPKYQPSHYEQIPYVNWDAPEADRLDQQREVLRRTKYNLSIAMEAFDLAWRQYEDVERQMAPHPFERQPHQPTTGHDAYTPPECRRCYKRRCDTRHGPVLPHRFAPCERSWRMGSDPAAHYQLCFECGLKQFDTVHEADPLLKVKHG